MSLTRSGYDPSNPKIRHGTEHFKGYFGVISSDLGSDPDYGSGHLNSIQWPDHIKPDFIRSMHTSITHKSKLGTEVK
ncbi:hypothetical protein Ahy_B03g066007 isoform B [Arachis hypogaea]|uniref:Uncharacterized protein n=1 Tax=Arachis hypogaea TaxID=3818 RepID=A0A445A331_ARAHY|nr:hypothetical protein Ahy_B03g066007 isoform B [Arachis hypogaea]